MTRAIRWVRRHQSNALVRAVIKPLGRALLMPYWRRKAKRFYSQLVNPNDLVFDIGAHKGDKAEIFLQLGARVVCFEPQSVCVEALREKFGSSDRVTIVPKGVGAKEGLLTLHVCSKTPVISTFSSDWKEKAFSEYEYDQEVPIEVTTLDQACGEFGEPAFAKIDVEGFEPEVLKGLSHRLPIISAEWSGNLLDNTVATIDSLSELGYEQFNIVFGETATFHFSTWVTADSLKELLRKPQEELLWAGGDLYARVG